MNAKNSENPRGTQRHAIIWGRFSSDQQQDGDSRSRQERLNRACAVRLGIKIIAEHFDPGTSVKDGITPLFRKVVAELPPGVGIVCENLDRINRGHPWRAKAFLLDLIDAGRFIVTSQDGKEYNSETIEEIETMVIGDMSANVARYENNKRIKRVREEKAKAIQLAREGKPAPLGAWLPAHIKFNFETQQYDFKKDKAGNEIAEITKRIFTEYASGKGASSVAQGLNQDGIPTFHSKMPGQWSRGTVCQLLRYEGVIGTLNINGERIPNAVPPAISEKLFYQVQKHVTASRGLVKQDANGNKVLDKSGKPVLVNGRHGNYQSENVQNIFRGVCHCVHCGGAMRIYGHGKKTQYLGCGGYREKRLGKDGKPCPAGDFVPFKEMEREFIQWFVPQAKDALLGKNEAQTVIETLTAKKNALQGKVEQTLSLLDTGLALNEVKARLVKLEDERQAVDAQIQKAKADQTSKAVMPGTLDELASLVKQGTDGNQETRKRIASIVPAIVKDCLIDLADKHNPSFKVILVDGQEIQWHYTPIVFATPAVMGKKHPKGKVLVAGYKQGGSEKKTPILVGRK